MPAICKYIRKPRMKLVTQNRKLRRIHNRRFRGFLFRMNAIPVAIAAIPVSTCREVEKKLSEKILRGDVRYMKSEGAIMNISPAAFRITAAVMILACLIKRFLMHDIAPKMSVVKTIIWSSRLRSEETGEPVPIIADMYHINVRHSI